MIQNSTIKCNYRLPVLYPTKELKSDLSVEGDLKWKVESVLGQRLDAVSHSNQLRLADKMLFFLLKCCKTHKKTLTNLNLVLPRMSLETLIIYNLSKLLNKKIKWS